MVVSTIVVAKPHTNNNNQQNALLTGMMVRDGDSGFLFSVVAKLSAILLFFAFRHIFLVFSGANLLTKTVVIN